MPLNRRWIKRASLFTLLALSLAALPFPAQAAGGSADHVSFAQKIVVNQDETVGDLVCFLCAIEVHGQVHGDVVSFLGGIKADGSIQGDAVSFLGDINLIDSGAINGDMVVMGGALHKSEEAHVGKDQVIFPVALFLIPFIILGAIIWGITRLFRRRHPIYFAPMR